VNANFDGDELRFQGLVLDSGCTILVQGFQVHMKQFQIMHVNRNSGKLLDVSDDSTADGANIIQWTGNGGINQKWSFTKVY
jgi:hypothetical protein